MIAFKPEVFSTIPLVKILLAVERTYAHFGYDAVVTSCNDGKHMVGSRHYTDHAADIRTWNVQAVHITPIGVRLRQELGEDYDVVFEPDLWDDAGIKTRTQHYHLEYQPKGA